MPTTAAYPMHQSCATCLAVPGSSIGRLRTYVLVQVTEQSNPKLHRGLVVVARLLCSASAGPGPGGWSFHVTCMHGTGATHAWIYAWPGKRWGVGPSAGADKITSGDYSIVLPLPLCQSGPRPLYCTTILGDFKGAWAWQGWRGINGPAGLSG